MRATGLADQIIIEEYFGQKIDDIQRYDVDIFAIGSDWEGKFDYLNEYCKVVYLPRTEGISSTMLREEKQATIKVGIVGCGNIARRFVPEAAFVSGIEITGVYDIDITVGKEFARSNDIPDCYNSFEEMLKDVDAVYIATPHLSHYEYAKSAIEKRKHVLCEIPLVPIFKLLGTDYINLNIYSRMENGVDIYTKGVLRYPSAICSFKIGLGVKTEGNLVISGTKGYAYVEAPWWKTDFFELRYEDQNKNKKFFYKWDGEGLRYEIQEWMSCIINKRPSSSRLLPKESIAIARVMQQFTERTNMMEI